MSAPFSWLRSSAGAQSSISFPPLHSVTTKNFNIYDPLSQGQALILDGQTLAHIEVLQNSQGGQEGTLFQLLSRCVTPFGKRLFKIWLCAPLRTVEGINDR